NGHVEAQPYRCRRLAVPQLIGHQVDVDVIDERAGDRAADYGRFDHAGQFERQVRQLHLLAGANDGWVDVAEQRLVAFGKGGGHTAGRRVEDSLPVDADQLRINDRDVRFLAIERVVLVPG